MKKISNIILIVSSVVGILFSSCQEKVKWDVKSVQSRLVVEGQISTEVKNHQVKLSRTSDLYEVIDRIPVTGASISITDGITIYGLNEITGEEGNYETGLAFGASPGNKYTLSINLLNPINDVLHYEASDSMNSPFTFEYATAYEEGFYLNEDEDSSYNTIAYLYGKQPHQTEKFYLGNLYKKDSLITNTILKSVLVDPKEWGTEDDDIVPLIYFDYSEKLIYDTLNFELHTISKEYYKFIREVILSDNEPDPLGLSGPQANIKGNVSNGGLGFFSAFATETGQFYVQKEEEIK